MIPLPTVMAVVLAASPYSVDPAIDGAITVGAGALVGLEGIVKPTLAGGISCGQRTPAGRCDPSTLSWPDRTVVGNDSAAWRTVSDAGIAVAVAVPLLADGIDVALGGEGLGDYAKDVVVMAESLALAGLTTEVVKLAVRRPRPTQYREGAYVGSVEAQLSFPSGHADAVAATTTAYAVTFTLRHPDSPWRWAVYSGALAVTAATAYGRVGGGMHFYTDVVAGAVVGAAFGLVVPLAHRTALRVTALAVEGAPGARPARGLAVAMAL